MRLTEPAEEDAQHGVGIGGRADGGARVGAHPLLADDDRRCEPLEVVDVGAGEGGHEALDERAVGRVDHPLRLRGDRREHQRALARPRDAGHDDELAGRDVEIEIAQIVLARAADGAMRVRMSRDGKGVYVSGVRRYGREWNTRAPRPWLDRVEIENASRARLLDSPADVYEEFVAALDDAFALFRETLFVFLKVAFEGRF